MVKVRSRVSQKKPAATHTPDEPTAVADVHKEEQHQQRFGDGNDGVETTEVNKGDPHGDEGECQQCRLSR
jgi:hypothetical protein